jgi:protein-S-isoprenylcysteine O-methyltransferase Ste14
VTGDDEPLEGDIGPASTRPEARRTAEAEADDQLRYEAEREERRRRTNAVAGRLTLVLVAALLAFLAYDSITTAVEAHRLGDPWLYPPATIAAICLLALLALLTLTAWAARRRR